MKSKKLITEKTEAILSVIILTMTFIITGGMPISNVVYYAIEQIYNVQMPSYNINYNLNLISDYRAEKSLMKDMEVVVDSSSKLQTIMNSKGIYITYIDNVDPLIAEFRIDGYENVRDYLRILEGITISDIVLNNKLLNEEELIVTITKNE